MPDTRAWTFYILRCADGSLYCGIALDAAERQRAHNAGQGADYTARRRPVHLVHTEVHPTKVAARTRVSLGRLGINDSCRQQQG